MRAKHTIGTPYCQPEDRLTALKSWASTWGKTMASRTSSCGGRRAMADCQPMVSDEPSHTEIAYVPLNSTAPSESDSTTVDLRAADCESLPAAQAKLLDELQNDEDVEALTRTESMGPTPQEVAAVRMCQPIQSTLIRTNCHMLLFNSVLALVLLAIISIVSILTMNIFRPFAPPASPRPPFWGHDARSYLTNEVVQKYGWEASYFYENTTAATNGSILFWSVVEVLDPETSLVWRAPGQLSHNHVEARESAAEMWLLTFQSLFSNITHA